MHARRNDKNPQRHPSANPTHSHSSPHPLPPRMTSCSVIIQSDGSVRAHASQHVHPWPGVSSSSTLETSSAWRSDWSKRFRPPTPSCLCRYVPLQSPWLSRGASPFAANQSTHVLDPSTPRTCSPRELSLHASELMAPTAMPPRRPIANRCPEQAKHPSSASIPQIPREPKTQTHFCQACDSS